MEAQLSESSVFPSQSYAASFFTKFPTDSRFLKVSHQSFMPVRIIDGKDIEFSLDRYTAGNVIMIQDTILNVRLQILKADGVSLPDKTKNVAPRNNILHTLFSSVALHINNVQISSAPENYCYKAYFTNVISYSQPAKNTHLKLQGYEDDTVGFFDSADPLVNTGFAVRNVLFRKNFNAKKEYRAEGAMFSGRLYHELSSCETGLPPNTKVRIVLTKNKDSFILQCPEDDDEKYQVKITNIFLTVPIAQLSQNVYDELSYLMSKKENTKPVTIQYRKFEVLPISVPKYKQDYQTGDLFTDGDLPCRIILAFVDAKARLGDYHKNPYYFLRKWEIEQEEAAPIASKVEKRINYLEEIVQKLSRNQTNLPDETEPATLSGASSAVPVETSSGPNLLSSQTSTSAGPLTSGTVKTSSTVTTRSTSAGLSRQSAVSVTSLQPTTDTVNIEDRINSLLSQKLEQLLPKKNDALAISDNKAFVWISNIKVTLNNALIDQIDDSQSKDECLNSYYRLCQTTGVLNSPFANGISYDQFRY